MLPFSANLRSGCKSATGSEAGNSGWLRRFAGRKTSAQPQRVSSHSQRRAFLPGLLNSGLTPSHLQPNWIGSAVRIF